MKTLFVLVSVMVVLFIATPNKVEAQKKKTTKKQTAAILVSSTEGATKGEKMASAPIVTAVLNGFDKDDLESLHRCMSENRIKKNAAKKLFVSVLLAPISRNQQIYFVRGSLNTPCPFIGAHAFRYWLVVKSISPNSVYNVRYSGFSDVISILRSVHNGMYDIESMYFTATNATSVKMQFNGSKYVETICKEYHRTNRGKEVVKIIPCDDM